MPGGGVRARLGGSVLEVGGAGAGAWHQVRLEVTATNLSLSLDSSHTHTVPCPADQQGEVSRAATNQYVYVGGLPSWYSTKLQVGHRTYHIYHSLCHVTKVIIIIVEILTVAELGLAPCFSFEHFP